MGHDVNLKVDSQAARTFAIIPAAGHSARMGQPKLLLPWRGKTLFDQTLQVWTESKVDYTIVVIRKDDEGLAAVGGNWPVEIVRPARDPIDMKESIQWGLQHVAGNFAPTEHDRWIVAPADLPGLTMATINAIVSTKIDSDSVIAPRYGIRRGHPVSFPWRLAQAAFQLKVDQGIDQLMIANRVTYVEFPREQAIDDIDTPDDYQRHVSSREATAGDSQG